MGYWQDVALTVVLGVLGWGALFASGIRSSLLLCDALCDAAEARRRAAYWREMLLWAETMRQGARHPVADHTQKVSTHDQ